MKLKGWLTPEAYQGIPLDGETPSRALQVDLDLVTEDEKSPPEYTDPFVHLDPSVVEGAYNAIMLVLTVEAAPPGHNPETIALAAASRNQLVNAAASLHGLCPSEIEEHLESIKKEGRS